MKKALIKLPGWIGTGLITFLNGVWLFWGLSEAFYEGWGVPDTPWFLFLSIGVAGILFSILAIRYPYVGGGILMVAGAFFAIWWLVPGIQSGFYTLSVVIERLLLSGGFAFVGLLFILDAKFIPREDYPGGTWILRNLRLLLAIGIPVIVAVIVAAVNLPIVLTREDDGIRSARLIKGNDVSLIWAPQGPGWNWRQEFGGYPSWDSLAFYGVRPHGLDVSKRGDQHATEEDMRLTGLCAYLDRDGQNLLAEPQYIWRMPTVDEIVRSLSRHNQNAGCIWNGQIGRLECELHPDKETPLWAPDEPPVYYWASNDTDDENAYYISYTGFVRDQPKDWGNPRHGYRCVKEP